MRFERRTTTGSYILLIEPVEDVASPDLHVEVLFRPNGKTTENLLREGYMTEVDGSYVSYGVLERCPTPPWVDAKLPNCLKKFRFYLRCQRLASHGAVI